MDMHGHTHIHAGRIVGKRRPVCPWLPSSWAGSLSSLNCDSHWHCLDGQLWWGGMLRQAPGDSRKRIVGYVSLTRENKGQKKTEGDRAITGCVWRFIESLFFAEGWGKQMQELQKDRKRKGLILWGEGGSTKGTKHGRATERRKGWRKLFFIWIKSQASGWAEW